MLCAQAPLVRAVHEGRRQEKICGRTVARNRDVVDDGDPQQRFYVHIARVRGQRISEENDEIETPFNDRGAHLLIASQRAALEPGDGQSKLGRQERPGRSGCI